MTYGRNHDQGRRVMYQVSVKDGATQWDALVQAALNGEEIMVTQDEKPIMKWSREHNRRYRSLYLPDEENSTQMTQIGLMNADKNQENQQDQRHRVLSG